MHAVRLILTFGTVLNHDEGESYRGNGKLFYVKMSPCAYIAINCHIAILMHLVYLVFSFFTFKAFADEHLASEKQTLYPMTFVTIRPDAGRDLW